MCLETADEEKKSILQFQHAFQWKFLWRIHSYYPNKNQLNIENSIEIHFFMSCVKVLWLVKILEHRIGFFLLSPRSYSQLNPSEIGNHLLAYSWQQIRCSCINMTAWLYGTSSFCVSSLFTTNQKFHWGALGIDAIARHQCRNSKDFPTVSIGFIVYKNIFLNKTNVTENDAATVQ